MQNRLPGAPGQFTMVVQPEQVQNLLDGKESTITLIRDDQPLIVGTPFNKASMLPDSLAVRLCPNIVDPTPAQALKGLTDSVQVFTCILKAADWVASGSSFVQTVACEGMKASYTLEAPQVEMTGIYATDQVLKEALNTLCEAGNSGKTLDGQIQWICYNSKPTADLPLKFRRIAVEEPVETTDEGEPIVDAVASAAIKLVTPRSINGVPFDGTQDIEIKCTDDTEIPSIPSNTTLSKWKEVSYDINSVLTGTTDKNTKILYNKALGLLYISMDFSCNSIGSPSTLLLLKDLPTRDKDIIVNATLVTSSGTLIGYPLTLNTGNSLVVAEVDGPVAAITKVQCEAMVSMVGMGDEWPAIDDTTALQPDNSNPDLELLYSYDGAEGKILTNFDCGDANLLLVYFDAYSPEQSTGLPVIVYRQDGIQYCSISTDFNIFTSFTFLPNGIFNQISQRQIKPITPGGEAAIGEDSLLRMVVRRIYKIKSIDKSNSGSSTSGITEQPNAGFHNSIFRGKYLGDHITEEQWASIEAGTFEDMYIGDYWKIPSTSGYIREPTLRIAAFDYFYGLYDTNSAMYKKHHVVIVTDELLYDSKMNASSSTMNNYIYSALYKDWMPSIVTQLKNIFGEQHLINMNLTVAASDENGRPDSVTTLKNVASIMNQLMVFGNNIILPNFGTSKGYRPYYTGQTQFPLFRHAPQFIVAENIIGSTNYKRYWLMDKFSSSQFVMVAKGDITAIISESTDTNGTIRPFCCITKDASDLTE